MHMLIETDFSFTGMNSFKTSFDNKMNSKQGGSLRGGGGLICRGESLLCYITGCIFWFTVRWANNLRGLQAVVTVQEKEGPTTFPLLL